MNRQTTVMVSRPSNSERRKVRFVPEVADTPKRSDRHPAADT